MNQAGVPGLTRNLPPLLPVTLRNLVSFPGCSRRLAVGTSGNVYAGRRPESEPTHGDGLLAFPRRRVTSPSCSCRISDFDIDRAAGARRPVYLVQHLRQGNPQFARTC